MGRPNFGSIKRLGPNVYRIWWGKGRRADGKRDRHSETIHGTREDAEVALAQRVGAKRAPQGMTWGRFWRVYVEPTYEGLAKRTVDDYRKLYADYLEPHIKEMQVSDTDEVEVDAVLSLVRSPATQRHVKDLWRKACRIAVRRRLLDRCPIDSDTPLKPMRPRRKRLLDASEVKAWMDGIRGHKGELCLLCMLGGGLRPEEAYGLDLEDVAEWEGYALVSVRRALTYSYGKVLKETKTGFSEREVVIGAPFAARVLELSQGSGPAHPNGRGGRSSPNSACNNYRGWCQRHGVVYVAPKDLRSSYATMHGEAGSLDSLVSASMGHTDGTTKGRHYQAVTRRGLSMIADSLADFLAGF